MPPRHRDEAEADMARVLGAHLRELRLGKGLSMKRAGKRARINQSAISRIESGEHAPEISTAFRLAAVYGKTLAELVSVLDREFEFVDEGRAA